MSKSFLRISLGCTAAIALLLTTGCGDTSDSGYRTSGGADINYTGFFQGVNGKPMVSASSGNPIMTMTLFQTGSNIEAVDNNGSTYKGGVGRPAGLSTPGQQFYANQSVLQSQMSMEGWDQSSGFKARVVGVFTIVTVTDIDGVTVDQTLEQDLSTDTENTTENSQETSSETTIEPDDTGGTNPPPNSGTGAPTGGSTITTSGSMTTTTTRTSTNTQTGTTTDTTSTTVTRQFELTRANNQVELRGNWLEEGGVSSTFSGVSEGAIGTITEISGTSGTGSSGGSSGTGGQSAGMGIEAGGTGGTNTGSTRR